MSALFRFYLCGRIAAEWLIDMTQSRKFVLKETALVFAGVMLCVGLMWGVYAMLNRFSMSVLLGGIVGGVLATANFFFMAVGATLAADKAQQDNVGGGKATIRSSYLIRLAVLFVILFACGKSGWFDLIALVLPLIFVRPVLSIVEFFRKSGDKNQ